MKLSIATAFAAALLMASAPAHAGRFTNGLSLQGLSFQGLSLQGLSLQGKLLNGTASDAGAGAITVQSVTLPDGSRIALK